MSGFATSTAESAEQPAYASPQSNESRHDCPVGVPNPIAALRPVGGVEEIQVVGAVAEAVLSLCGITTDARSVWIHPNVVRKLEKKRPGMVDFILDHLAAAIIDPDYCGLDPRDPDERRLDIVHLVASHGDRPIFVALKVVEGRSAATGSDEIWVSTAYILSAQFLTQARYRDNLVKVKS